MLHDSLAVLLFITGGFALDWAMWDRWMRVLDYTNFGFAPERWRTDIWPRAVLLVSGSAALGYEFHHEEFAVRAFGVALYAVGHLLGPVAVYRRLH